MSEELEQVERIRGTNNILWMTILRIAMESEPARTKLVLRNINRNDKRISELLNRLAE